MPADASPSVGGLAKTSSLFLVVRAQPRIALPWVWVMGVKPAGLLHVRAVIQTDVSDNL